MILGIIKPLHKDENDRKITNYIYYISLLSIFSKNFENLKRKNIWVFGTILKCLISDLEKVAVQKMPFKT